MVTLAYSEQLEEIAKELDFGSVKGLITDVMTTRILSHISDFSEEIEGFELKHNKNYETASRESEEMAENFQLFDDLMAWRFAQEGKVYWQNRLKELSHVL